ncbi:hypothetical protein HRI_001499900 [Hibiscus trionum]|uniref:DUF7745 domain-containing protein n=1 Tax=Hibiscus trionum TaxID=183268 RepID=A0A9W7LW99_HIBTR|nr:hypothetical protein HRI_001499900 [Hibiscus trionum]
MDGAWFQGKIVEKGGSHCIAWSHIWNLIQLHPDFPRKRRLFALCIYGFIILPRALGHIDYATTYLFNKLEKGINPMSAILVETFRSLGACRRLGGGRFLGCTPLL